MLLARIRGAVSARAIVAAVAATTLIGGVGAVGDPAGATSSGTPALTKAQVSHILQPTPRIHIAPTVPIARRLRATLNPDTVGNLTYHGGAVMQAADNSVPIFWMPSTLQDGTTSGAPSVDYIPLVKRYFNDVGGNRLYDVATQYYQTINGPTEFIQNSSGMVIAIVDTSSYPVAGPGCSGSGNDCVDDSQLQAEVSSVITANGTATDASTQYFVFLAPHESTCFNTTDCFKADNTNGSNFKYCAYHTYFDYNGTTPVIYASMPYGATAFGGECTSLSSFPNDPDADIVLSTTSHEMIEAATDPYLTGWYFQDLSGEIGDECAYDYGALSYPGGNANESWNGHLYVLQQEWSNAISGCSQGTTGIPANDNFANAQTLSGASGAVGGSNVNSSKEAGEPTPIGNPGGSSVWYKFTPPSSGTLNLDTCGSNYDTLLGVYTGSAVNALTGRADNDDGSCAPGSSLSLSVAGGTVYRVEVDGYNGVTGSIILDWSFAASAVKPVASAGSASVYEGDSGTHTIEFPVTLSAPATSTVTVHYKVFHGSGDTATAGSDFVASTGTLTYNAAFSGKTGTVQQIPVTIKGDTTKEANERFSVQLTSATNATLGVALSHGNILNDDKGSGVRLTVSNVSIVEGNQVATAGGSNYVQFHIHLSKPVPSGKTVKVTYHTVAGTATGGTAPGSGIDFLQLGTTTVTFTAGQSDKIVQVRTFADTTHESNETFSLTVTSATNATLESKTGTGTIVNDD